jgi:hypothetical protein
MRPHIPEELEKLIDEKIFLDLEFQILNNKLQKAIKENNKNKIIFFESEIKLKNSEIKKVNDELRKHNVKIQKPISDDMFVQYNFSIKTNGGYKQDYFRYWKDAMKLKLKRRFIEQKRKNNNLK